MSGRHRIPVAREVWPWRDAVIVFVIFAVPIGSAVGLPIVLGGWLI